MMLNVNCMSTPLKNTSVSSGADAFLTNGSHSSSEVHQRRDNFEIMKDVAMGIMISVTGTGNAIIILCFVGDANVQTQSNCFLLNLAICDFFIGTLSTPMYMVNFIMNGRWILGSEICKAWMVIDYGITQCSVFSIILITYDRFLAITNAVAYRDQQHHIISAVSKMSASWVLSFVIYGPVIIFWEDVAGYSNIPDGECNPDFFYSKYFNLGSFIIATTYFFVPLVCILVLNINIYINIRSRTKAKQSHLFIRTSRSKVKTDNADIFNIYMNKTEYNKDSPESAKNKRHDTKWKKMNVLKNILPNESLNGVFALEVPVDSRPKVSQTPQMTLIARDIKIVKSLSVLVGTFFLCWAPYSILMIAQAICGHNCIPRDWYDTSYLFTYLNSSLNPFIYPLCHPAFRKAFTKCFLPMGCGSRFARNKRRCRPTKTAKGRHSR